MPLLPSADFFKINFLKKSLRNANSKCQSISTNILLVLIWVQTFCKGYQQMTKDAASKEGLIYNLISGINFGQPTVQIYKIA